MLSQQCSSLRVGCDTRSAAAPRQLLAVPPHPQHLLAGICPALQYQLGTLSSTASRYPQQHTTKTSRDYAGSRAQDSSILPTAEKNGARTIMHPTTSASPSSTPRTVRFPFRIHQKSDAAFSFNISPKPDMPLIFPPRPPPPRPSKRCRAVTDIDGEHSCLYKKKRRLRLFLITSRLSPHYSHPATNIVDRGSSKIAVWAKQRALGRNLLRKAAILNHIQRQSSKARGAAEGFINQEREQQQLELARLTLTYGSHDTQTRPVFQRTPSFPPGPAVRVGDHFEVSRESSSASSSADTSPASSENGDTEEETYRSPNDAYASLYPAPRAQIPRRHHLPLPPSPLGLSNYDAFDLEDEIPDPYSHLDDEEEADEEDDSLHELFPQSPSASTSASYTSTLSTAPTGTSELVKTPPQMVYSDFSVLDLDPDEPVVGDHDQIEDGVWPNNMVPGPLPPASLEDSSTLPASCSPNFTVLLALSHDVPPMQGKTGGAQLADVLDRREAEIKKERERQRNLMFMRFNPQ